MYKHMGKKSKTGLPGKDSQAKQQKVDSRGGKDG